jgi:hypothetical protein
MDRRPRTRLVLVRGGRPRDAGPPEDAAAPPALRVVRGGAADELQADLERAIATARRIRQEIQDRISRALDDPPAP